MTKASEVTVTFDEVVRFHELQEEAGTSTALAAFLAARVPDAMQHYPAAPVSAQWVAGHNKLRYRILKGSS